MSITSQWPQEGPENYWWKEDEKSLYERIFNYVSFLEKNQPYVLEDAKRNLKLYGNNDLFGIMPKAYTNNRVDRLKLNIIKSISDTVTSKVSKNKVKPTFLTSGGDWSIQQKAKKLEKFAMGQLYSTKFYQKAAVTFLECCVFGTGCLKIYHLGKEIYLDRVLGPLELRVDQADALYGEPRSLFQVKYIAREVLIDLFPDHETAILQAKKASNYEDIGLINFETQADIVKVIEGWHLRSSKDAKDGLHAIAIDNQTLLAHEWKRDYFPFAFINWTNALSGFWGVGISEILMGLQIEINKILKENQTIFHLMDIPQVWLENGSAIVSTTMDNQIGAIHKFSGSPPIPQTKGSVSQERFNYLIWLINTAYELAGVSQLSAQSKKPEGLDSGKALRTFHDIETERFATVSRNWEDFTLNVVKQHLDLAREIDEEEGGYEVLVGSNRYAQKIKWKEINLKEDQYILQVYPTSLLPQEPAGRLQTVQEMMQAGLYTPEEGRKLLDFPDIEALNSYLNADQEDIEKLIEYFIDEGEYLTPEPFQNLRLGIVMMQRAYLRSKIDQVPEEKLELFRRWIAQASSMLSESQSPPIGEPQLPQARPEPMPTNELIPNVPQESISLQ